MQREIQNSLMLWVGRGATIFGAVVLMFVLGYLPPSAAGVWIGAVDASLWLSVILQLVIGWIRYQEDEEAKIAAIARSIVVDRTIPAPAQAERVAG